MKKNTLKAGIAVVIVLLLCSLGLGWTIIRRGFSARDEPSFIEAFVARRVRLLGTPSKALELKNPVPASPAALAEAMEHFADHCAFCHANDGSGQTGIGKGLYPKPPDMRKAETQDLSDGELYYIIENGIRLTGMPAFGKASAADKERNEATWKLVQFIRHLPAITPDELIAMKDLNPKSPAELKEEAEIQKFLRGEDVAAPSAGHHNHE